MSPVLSDLLLREARGLHPPATTLPPQSGRYTPNTLGSFWNKAPISGVVWRYATCGGNRCAVRRLCPNSIWEI
ncbi:hypothetical protein SAMCCGM7_pC1191 (plasmid) [Sinorhizobium americanum CCGM7]|nr:hypothetical protein SAMCCGM7_pC1191 [Sinorhizobium americanum CCGM7]